MRILIDVMSGDNAPLALLAGAVQAAEELPCEIAVLGDETLIGTVAAENKLDLSHVTVIPTNAVVTMEDDALCVVRDKKDSSMARGLSLLAEGKGDAFLSAGNTGALIAGATLIVRKIRGIRRAAIGTVLPFDRPLLLLDAGANVEVLPEDFVQFAKLGSVYMERMFARKTPRVGLLNNGTEPTKGGACRIDAYTRLTEEKTICFIGNVETRELPNDPCDVLVTDGFTGNAVLKTVEGMGGFFFAKLRDTVSADTLGKVCGFALRSRLRELKEHYSASAYGGAPILGISKPVIKAHGSSDAEAIRQAARQAYEIASSGVIAGMARLTVPSTEKKGEEL